MQRDERNDEVLRALANKPRWRWGDAKMVLEALDESGVSIAAFCRDTGLKYFRVLQWNGKNGGKQKALQKDTGGFCR